MKRRDFLRQLSFGAATSLLSGSHGFGATDFDFRFAHITDTHLQPERRAALGCRQCFRQVSSWRPDFAIMGGDLVFDVNEVKPERADLLFDLYLETAQLLEVPVYHVVGNHDLYGLSPRSPVARSDTCWGKQMFEDRIGPRYFSFDYLEWHFILLDSVQITGDGAPALYVGELDPVQLQWLEKDLKQTGTARPVVIATHIPFLTTFSFYAHENPPGTTFVVNRAAFQEIIADYNVKVVLQGHTHICEVIEHRNCLYISSGAVCGDWWRGPRMGIPEGYGLLTVRGRQIDWSYHSYGFQREG